MSYKEIIDRLENGIDALKEQAQIIVDDHWSFHTRNNASLPPKEKGRLNVWVRCRNFQLEIYWTYFVFYKKPNTSKSKVYSKYIPKGKGHKYRDKKLISCAKSWEIDKVLETEAKMEKIRSEYSDLKSAISALKRAEKKYAEYRAMNLN